MKTVLATVDIDAPPAVVWTVLTDLDRYAEWNPFVVRAAGDVAVGARLRVRITPEGGRATTFRPVVTAVEPERRFAWSGRLWGVPRLFDGTHRFELGRTATGTHLVQAEDFRGLLLPLLSRSLDAGTRAGFEAMNAALARRAEQLAARSS